MKSNLNWLKDQGVDPRKVGSYMRYLTKIYQEDVVWHSQTIRDAYRIRPEDLEHLEKHGLIVVKERTVGTKTRTYVTAKKALLDLPPSLFKPYLKAVRAADGRADTYAEEFEDRSEPRHWDPSQLD